MNYDVYACDLYLEYNEPHKFEMLINIIETIFGWNEDTIFFAAVNIPKKYDYSKLPFDVLTKIVSINTKMVLTIETFDHIRSYIIPNLSDIIGIDKVNIGEGQARYVYPAKYTQIDHTLSSDGKYLAILYDTHVDVIDLQLDKELVLFRVDIPKDENNP